MISVSLKCGTLRGPLQLERDPLYLRFVMQSADWTTLDALDQPSDLPKPNEVVYAARRTQRGNVHVDGVKNGKRFGQWLATAQYELVKCDLTQEQLRDRGEWERWCFLRQVEATNGNQ